MPADRPRTENACEGCEGKKLTVWVACHTFKSMKMTMHIDEDLLASAMEATGARTKTEAVSLALKEISRRVRQKKLFATPVGTSGKDPKSYFDFDTYDALRAAEAPGTYGARRRR